LFETGKEEKRDQGKTGGRFTSLERGAVLGGRKENLMGDGLKG